MPWFLALFWLLQYWPLYTNGNTCRYISASPLWPFNRQSRLPVVHYSLMSVQVVGSLECEQGGGLPNALTNQQFVFHADSLWHSRRRGGHSDSGKFNLVWLLRRKSSGSGKGDGFSRRSLSPLGTVIRVNSGKAVRVRLLRSPFFWRTECECFAFLPSFYLRAKLRK